MEAIMNHPAPAGNALTTAAADIASRAMSILDPIRYVAEVFQPFRTELGLLKAEAATVAYDIATAAGMKVAIEYRAKFRTLRLNAEKAREERKAPILEIGRLLDSRAKELKEEIAPLEARFDKDIKAEDARKEAEKQAKIAAEQARVRAIRDKINAVRALPSSVVGKAAAQIGELIVSLTPADDLAAYAEFAGEYAQARAEVLQQLEQARAAQVAAEAAAEAQRAEAARLQAERDELAKLRAAAKAEAERQAKEQADRERVAAETKRQLEAQAAQIAAERRALEEQKATAAQAAALAAQREEDHAEALRMDAEYNAERARLQAAHNQLLADARAPAPIDAILADAAGAPVALLDAADAELYPTDDEIIDAMVESFNLTAAEAIERLARFVVGAARLERDHAAAMETHRQFYIDPLPSGQRYSGTTFKDNGDPILLCAEGKRSVFCDLCDDEEVA